MNYRESGSGGVQIRRSPRGLSYRKASTREKVVPGTREDGDLAMDEVTSEREPSLGEFRDSLRLLARWLAREVLKKEKSRKVPKTREIQPPKSAISA